MDFVSAQKTRRNAHNLRAFLGALGPLRVTSRRDSECHHARKRNRTDRGTGAASANSATCYARLASTDLKYSTASIFCDWDRMSLTLRLKALPTTTPTLSVAFERDSPGRVIACPIGWSNAKHVLTATWANELKPRHCPGL